MPSLKPPIKTGNLHIDHRNQALCECTRSKQLQLQCVSSGVKIIYIEIYIIQKARQCMNQQGQTHLGVRLCCVQVICTRRQSKLWSFEEYATYK